jgi:hypothetical protein
MTMLLNTAVDFARHVATLYGLNENLKYTITDILQIPKHSPVISLDK